MDKTEQQEETTSIKREFERETISLSELYNKFQKKDIDYKVYLVRESPYRDDEIFELVGTLGTGRSCFVFLALIEKKLVSLRMCYEQTDFKNKFDSVRVEMENGYDEYFLNILYPSIPVDYLCVGSIKKKNLLFFDRKVYTSFWEKADATLGMKLDARMDSKLRWFRECLKGLRIIHARGRAHFDIKLGNLFLVNNHLKIGDFEYYLKIEDFVRSKIYYCGTPGHIAPEMFYDKKNLTHRIDIFSAGVAFARLFTAAEPSVDLDAGLTLEGEADFTPEDEADFDRLFTSYPDRLPPKKIRDAFKNNFKIFNFYRKYIEKELENRELPLELQQFYPILLSMMNVDPVLRPGANDIIREIGKIVEIPETSEEKLKLDGKRIDIPVFTIGNLPVTFWNLNKKNSIEIGSVKQKQHPDDPGLNDINLRFIDISRKHLQINYVKTLSGEEIVEVFDIHSKHGVMVNNERVESGKPWVLNSGDVIQLGSIVSFKFTREEGYYLFRNITWERKKGNLIWLDKKQANELPDNRAVIVLLKDSLSLTSFGYGEDALLVVDEEGNFEVRGWSVKGPVNGEVVL
jgi:serine/threonine protein kinase